MLELRAYLELSAVAVVARLLTPDRALESVRRLIDGRVLVVVVVLRRPMNKGF